MPYAPLAEIVDASANLGFSRWFRTKLRRLNPAVSRDRTMIRGNIRADLDFE
jgi:hypothetical protein